MQTPLNPPLVVPFQGKTYNCDLVLAALPQIEGELNIGILCPTADSLWAKPEFYQRAVLLYCLLKSTPLKGLSFARCAQEVVGPNALRLADILKEAAERLQPQVMALNNMLPPSDEAERPTDAQSIGQDSGQSES
jgi:hypothetical protein